MAEDNGPVTRQNKHRRHLRQTALVTVCLAVIWVLLWGDLSLGGWLTGLVIGAVLSNGIRQLPTTRRYRPSVLGHLHFIGVFAVELVTSTVDVARRVLRSPDSLRPATFTLSTGPRDPIVLVMATSVMTITPGTITIDVDPVEGTVLVHVLHLEPGGEQEVQAAIDRFVRLAERAVRPASPPGVPLSESDPITTTNHLDDRVRTPRRTG